MDGSLNERQVGIFVLKSSDCPGASMRRTVVDDPENPSCPAIGMLFHDLIDEAVNYMPHAAYLVHENVGAITAQSGAEAVNVQQCLGLVQTLRLTGRSNGQYRNQVSFLRSGGSFFRVGHECLETGISMQPLELGILLELHKS